MRILVNCPDSTKIISIVAMGRKGSKILPCSYIWANQNLASIEDDNEITIQEPEEYEEGPIIFPEPRHIRRG